MRYFESQPEDSWADNENNPDSNQPKNLNKSQKIAAAVLAFFAFFVIIFWGFSFKNSLSQPFSSNSEEAKQQAGSLGSDEDENSEEALRNKDTDKDGLSDWDELYFYKTSPYLEDSDSDGYKDKEEIDSDNDPNCPRGRDCYGSGLLSEDKAAAPEGADNSEFLDDALDNLNALSESGETDQALDIKTLENLDAASLRQLLIDNGMDKTILDQISDQDLISSFQEILNSQ